MWDAGDKAEAAVGQEAAAEARQGNEQAEATCACGHPESECLHIREKTQDAIEDLQDFFEEQELLAEEAKYEAERAFKLEILGSLARASETLALSIAAIGFAVNEEIGG